MKVSISKSTVVQILLIVVIILLGINIILEKYYHPKPESEGIELPASVINNRFLLSLYNYNLDSLWISRRNIPKTIEDSLKFKYKVNVPTDLPVSLLLREIQDQFDTTEADIYSREFKSDNSTELKISSGGFVKLEALFGYNKSLKRKSDTLGFVLTDIEDLNDNELNTLLLLPEHFAVVLIPSKHSQELFKVLKENQKQTAVLLNDDISELEFKLNTGYSDRRIKSSVVSIIRKFYTASLFIIDDKSDIYGSPHLETIENEFLKRHIDLLNLSEFESLRNDSPREIINSIRIADSNKRVFMITAEEFLEMPPLLAGLRKTGYKFINPSLLVRK